MIINLFSRGV